MPLHLAIPWKVRSAAVFLASFAALAWNVNQNGIAAAFSDPIAHVRAQDESIYVNAAIRITQDGDWLTPKVMGRPYFQKPPMLMWLSAASLRVLGVSLFSVRLPSLLLGALGVTAVFLWCSRLHSLGAGLLAGGLLLMSPFWQILSRLCYTDIPASAFGLLALTCVAFDPHLDRRRTRIAVGVLAAAAVLSKGPAGILPVAALLVWWIVLPARLRPKLIAIAELLAALCVAVAPWYVYQLTVHRQWFVADMVQLAMLGAGKRPDQAGIFDRNVFYYGQRLLEMDPAAVLVAVAGIVRSWRIFRLREQPARLLTFCWAVMTIVGISAFQVRNLPYVVLALPPLLILGAGVLNPRPLIAGGVLVLAGILRIFGDAVAPPIDAAADMRTYYGLHRDAELIAVESNDEFYAATLPLPRVRYAFLDPAGSILRTVPHYVPTGIVLTAGQFASLPALLPQFRAELARLDWNSTEPVGTVISLRQPSELTAVILTHAGSDFYIPDSWKFAVESASGSHERAAASKGRVFLLSKSATLRVEKTAELPARW